MTTDLTMLAWTAGITILFWLPYILVRIATFGMMDALTYRSDSQPVADWAERAKKAHYNAVENLIPFAALVLVAHVGGAANEATAAAAVAYFWARLAHYPLYIANVPFGRTLTFAVSWLCMIVILYQIVT